MKKIEAIIRPEKFEDVKAALAVHDINGLTISQVMGCGNQIGKKSFYRGTVVEQALLPKIKIEIVIEDKNVDEIIESILKSAKTGEIGDGKIFIYDIENAIRIRTCETGEKAI